MNQFIEQITELFETLRKNGFPLGLDEYMLLIRALQLGFGQTNNEALNRLCQMIWLTSVNDKALFNYYFNQVITISFEQTASPKNEITEDCQPSLSTG